MSDFHNWHRGYADGQRDVHNFFVHPELANEEDGPLGVYLDGAVRGSLALWCLGHNLVAAVYMAAAEEKALKQSHAYWSAVVAYKTTFKVNQPTLQQLPRSRDRDGTGRET